MRRRFQKPRIKNRAGYWIAQYRDLEGRKRKVSLGPAAKTRRIDAETRLARLLEPINGTVLDSAADLAFGTFVRQVFFPFYKRKWKASTALCNENRIDKHLVAEFERRFLSSFSREELQTFLDRKAADGLSHSMVAHMRWDLRQVFRMAVTEGRLLRNPAELLFIPRDARRYPKPRLTVDQVVLLFSVLDLRERVIAGFAILSGLRPGEIFALRRCHLGDGYADIRQRWYRGTIDTPKTFHSQRWAALGERLSLWIKLWTEHLPLQNDDALLFPSENGMTPLSIGNCWKRNFLPKLRLAGLEWANFQVMRRTHSTLLYELDVDPQVRAEQMGHTVDVNQNQYTRTSLARRQRAVNLLEKALKLA